MFRSKKNKKNNEKIKYIKFVSFIEFDLLISNRELSTQSYYGLCLQMTKQTYFIMTTKISKTLNILQ